MVNYKKISTPIIFKYLFFYIYIMDSIIDIFNNQLIYNKNKIN